MRFSHQQLNLREQRMRELQASLHSDVREGGREEGVQWLHKPNLTGQEFIIIFC